MTLRPGMIINSQIGNKWHHQWAPKAEVFLIAVEFSLNYVCFCGVGKTEDNKIVLFRRIEECISLTTGEPLGIGYCPNEKTLSADVFLDYFKNEDKKYIDFALNYYQDKIKTIKPFSYIDGNLKITA